MFQSTHPHGVRPPSRALLAGWFSVSIHAPAWGATTHTYGLSPNLTFQSTHPHGVRHTGGCNARVPFEFQSTHPHGVRHRYRICSLTCGRVSIHAPAWGATRRAFRKMQVFSFNPRTRMGCDLAFHNYTGLPVEFQSTHPHGVRLCIHIPLIFKLIRFQLCEDNKK